MIARWSDGAIAPEVPLPPRRRDTFALFAMSRSPKSEGTNHGAPDDIEATIVRVGPRHPRVAPMMRIRPKRTSIGRRVRCIPRGVRRSCESNAPTSWSIATAVFTAPTGGGCGESSRERKHDFNERSETGLRAVSTDRQLQRLSRLSTLEARAVVRRSSAVRGENG